MPANEPTRVTRFTTAPQDYDGFGTVTVAVIGTDDRGRAVREVSIDPAHLEWQENRYASGMHVSNVGEWVPRYVAAGWWRPFPGGPVRLGGNG